MQHKKLINWRILLFGIFLIAIFFRFYNMPHRYNLGGDSIRDALVAVEGAKQMQFPLVGPFSSLGPFTFGPWYYYHLIIFHKLFPWIYSPWLFMSIASLLFIFVMYKIGECIQDKTLGIIIAFLVAISPALIVSGIGLTNPNLVPLYAALSILAVLHILKKNTYHWWFLLGLFLGIGANNHYQTFGLFILPVLLIVYLHNGRAIKGFLFTILGLFVAFLPLLFFDLNNHWFNTKNMLYHYIHGKDRFYVANRWLFYIRDFWPSFMADSLGVPYIGGALAALCIAGISGYVFYKKRLEGPLLVLLVAFFANFFVLRYYWGERSYGYLQFLYPFIFLFSGYTIRYLFTLRLGKYVGICLLILLFVAVYPKNMAMLQADGNNKEFNRQAKLLSSTFPNKEITLYACPNGYIYRAQSVALILSGYPKESTMGKKVLFPAPCVTDNLADRRIQDSEAFDVSNIREEDILKMGVIRVSAKDVFDSTTRWWFKEQP